MKTLLITSAEELAQIIPTSVGSDFIYMESFIREAQEYVIERIVSPDLLDKMTCGNSVYSNIVALIGVVGYAKAADQLNVIQTNNGFAVIKNETTVPASKDRVANLIISLNKRSLLLTDRIVSGLIREFKEQLMDSESWKSISEYFVVKPEQIPNDHSSSIEDYFSMAHAIQMVIENTIAPSLGYHFIEDLLHQSALLKLNIYQKRLVDSLVRNSYQLIVGAIKDPQRAIDNITIYVEAHLDDFPVYAASDIYKLKSTHINKADSPMFYSLN